MQKKKLTTKKKRKKKVEIKGSKGKDENVENRTDIKRIASQAVKKRMTFNGGIAKNHSNAEGSKMTGVMQM